MAKMLLKRILAKSVSILPSKSVNIPGDIYLHARSMEQTWIAADSTFVALQPSWIANVGSYSIRGLRG
jgi:hypothetical protein